MMEGGAGADTFVFNKGKDVIEDFSDEDVIELSASLGVSSFSEVISNARSMDGGDDVLIDFGGGNTLLLEDVQLSSLTSSDFNIL